MAPVTALDKRLILKHIICPDLCGVLSGAAIHFRNGAPVELKANSCLGINHAVLRMGSNIPEHRTASLLCKRPAPAWCNFSAETAM
jgi:hypothetical protein